MFRAQLFASTLRYLTLLALVMWVGALLFFGVVAYTAFSVLPSTHMAGLVVGGSLRHLHTMGLGCGVVLMLTLLLAGARGRPRAYAASLLLTIVMMVLTGVSQFGIMPAMERHRAAVGAIDSVPRTDPDRAAFDRLHVLSTQVEDGVLIAGLLLLGCCALDAKQ
jgi:hypothetical protein